MNPGKARNVGDLLRSVRATEAVHQSEIQRIVGRLNRKAPAIIAGDFNSTSFLAAPRWLERQGFIDSLASVTSDADEHPTWRWTFETGTARLRIDYIFHSREFTTLTSRVLAAGISDHALLVSKLTWALDNPTDSQPATEPAADGPATRPSTMPAE